MMLMNIRQQFGVMCCGQWWATIDKDTKAARCTWKVTKHGHSFTIRRRLFKKIVIVFARAYGFRRLLCPTSCLQESVGPQIHSSCSLTSVTHSVSSSLVVLSPKRIKAGSLFLETSNYASQHHQDAWVSTNRVSSWQCSTIVRLGAGCFCC